RPEITLTGWVDSVLPYLQSADIYVAPLRMGSGTRLKILEALAAGCGVVATPTAAAGLLPATKQAMRIAATEAEMIAAILALLPNTPERTALGQAAQFAVKENYDWSVLIPRLLAAYQTASQDA